MHPDQPDDREPVSYEIVEAVTTVKGVDPIDSGLDPLHDTIDAEALDTLYNRGFDGYVEFEYAGCTVAVSGDGEVEIISVQGGSRSGETDEYAE